MYLDDYQDIKYTSSKEEYYRLHDEDHIYLYEKGLILSDIGECMLRVNGFAGIVPHFEIISLDGKFKSCIKLYDPEYYFVGNEQFSKLTNQQIDELISFLTKENKQFGLYTHAWLSIRWRNLNIEKIYEHYEETDFLPDYTKLKEDK